MLRAKSFQELVEEQLLAECNNCEPGPDFHDGKDIIHHFKHFIDNHLLIWFGNKLELQIMDLSNSAAIPFLERLSIWFKYPIPSNEGFKNQNLPHDHDAMGEINQIAWKVFRDHSSKFKTIVDGLLKQNGTSAILNFHDLPDPTQEYILSMLETLCITQNNNWNLTERKKSAIRGVVEALKEASIIPNKGLNSLSKMIGAKIGLEIKSKLDYSNTSIMYKNKVEEYIQNYPIP